MPTPASRRPGRAPVVIDPAQWEQDLAVSSPRGRLVATVARREFERHGCPIAQLRPCRDEGRDGTRLPGCVKVYLPHPAGPFGMVFEIERGVGGLHLLVLAFGVRHHPRGSKAQTVYQRAHQRLHARD